MVESSPSVDEDEIDLFELIRTLLQAWKTIVGITIVSVGLAVAYALLAPEVYKAETLLAPASEEKSGVSSALSQFGGLAAMAGISIPAATATMNPSYAMPDKSNKLDAATNVTIEIDP